MNEVVAKCDHLMFKIANSCLGKRPIGPSGDLRSFDIAKCDIKT